MAMLCIAYAQSAYDYARLMWIAVGKQCALPVGFFFTVQQFDICCFRSVMEGLLQLSFELRRSFFALIKLRPLCECAGTFHLH